MPLPDSITKYIEPNWSALLPSGATLVIEREDGEIEVYATGRSFPWNDGANLERSRADFEASKLRRLEKALDLARR